MKAEYLRDGDWFVLEEHLCMKICGIKYFDFYFDELLFQVCVQQDNCIVLFQVDLKF